VYLGWVLFFFLLAYPALWYYKKDKDRYYSELARWRRWIARKSAFSAGFKFKIDTETKIDWSKNYVICANHTSNLDITALMIACSADCSFIGKEELLKNPVTALFFKTIDIPVNRSSKIASFRAFKKAQALLEDGKSIAIFPEGGIDNHFPPRLASFKIGAFKLAMDANVPILPVIIHDAWKLYWDDGAKYGTSPGVCHITILKPIEPESFLDADEFNEEVYETFQNIWRPQMVTI
jgi:1-acyl-sn-glycerol-3-phosphate acyltransferase